MQSDDQGAKSRVWFVTLNNPNTHYPDNSVEEIISAYTRIGGARFSCGQLEVGEEGTPHIHVWINYPEPVRFPYVKKIWIKANIQKFNESQHGRKYSLKEKGRLEGPYQFGILPLERNAKETRKSQYEYVKEHGIKKSVEDGVISLRDVPAIRKGLDIIESEEPRFVDPDKPFPYGPLRDFQQAILEWVDSPIDPDKIRFIVDPDEEGMAGKSKFAKWLYDTRRDFDLLNIQNKSDTVFMADSRCTTFWFDFERATEHISYSALECIKNGVWTSAKYTGKRVVGDPRRVIVSMNSYPDKTKLSKGRFEVFVVDKSHRDKLKWCLKYVPYACIP